MDKKFTLDYFTPEDVIPLNRYGFKEKAVTSPEFYIKWFNTVGFHKAIQGIINSDGTVTLIDPIGINYLHVANKTKTKIPIAYMDLKGKSPAFPIYPEIRGYDEKNYWQPQRGFLAYDIISSLGVIPEMKDFDIRKTLQHTGYSTDILSDYRIVKPFISIQEKTITLFPTEAKNKLRIINKIAKANDLSIKETLVTVGNNLTVGQLRKTLDIVREVDGTKTELSKAIDIGKTWNTHQYLISDEADRKIKEIKRIEKLKDEGQVVDKAIKYYYTSKKYREKQ